MYHFQPAAHGRYSNSSGSLKFILHTSLYLSVLSCPNMPGDFSVLVVTLDKLVRLRKRIRCLTSVAHWSSVCVFDFLLGCLFVFVHFQAWLRARESCGHCLCTVCRMVWWPVTIPHINRSLQSWLVSWEPIARFCFYWAGSYSLISWPARGFEYYTRSFVEILLKLCF